MTCYDVFNGDADGLCALHQLRLAEPLDSVLVTGVKRDIALLKRVQARAGDAITVLDVSLDKNRDALDTVLASGATVRYVDHHHPGEIPRHENLSTHIDTDATVCTGLLVDRLLEGRHRAWAITAAFGDNLFDSARTAAEGLSLSAARLDTLQELGMLMNYNGYGATLDDLLFDPADLYRRLSPYADPFDFIENDDAFATLGRGYADDRAQVNALEAAHENETTALYRLPDAAWARRIGGVWANELAQESPARAHALLTERADGAFVVSVRAPLLQRSGADELCGGFETGGGRKAAAGINRLPPDQVERFTQAFVARYG